MFRVERSPLLSEIWDLTQEQSVLLTGSPGVGKTWAIAQFIRRCKAEKRPNLPIAAEDFEIGSMDELTSALGFKREVLPFLEGLGEKAILIIDGLDALRGETSQRVFKELIGLVKDKIPRCAILASIRTFDLDQSDELQHLFFGSRIGPSSRQFRQVTVKPFSDADLEAVAKQVPGLGILLRDSGNDFRELLRNPFNLQLAAQLIELGMRVEELSLIQSQVQLLGKYWNIRVEEAPDGHDRKTLLRGVVQQMVERKALSVPEKLAYTTGLGPVFKVLKSSEILRQSITDRISFTHNIIFDYAVARLLLDEEAVFPFINEDRSRTIFYRPSLSFFFHYLWFQDRALFWNVAFRFFGSRELPERARVIAAVATYETVASPAELNPLIDSASDIGRYGLAGVLRAVQAFGGLRSERRKLWLSALGRLARHLDLEFVNEYVALVNSASEGAATGEERLIGVIAVNLLRWMWGLASSLGEERAIQIADVGAVRVLPVIMRFFRADPKESSQIVIDVMERFGSPISSSHEGFWLAQSIKSIIENDPCLAVEVYRRMFGYDETREDKTSMGGSLILSLTSTRRQDFSTARYGLLQGFQTFLELCPTDAVHAAISSNTAEIRRERSNMLNTEDVKEFSFRYGGHQATYRSDYSEIWDQGFRRYESLELLAASLTCAEEKLSSAEERALGEEMLLAFALDSGYAIAWRRLVAAAAVKCSAFYARVFELLTVPEFISAPEVTIGVGNLLKAAYNEGFVKDQEGLAIEKAISQLPQAKIILRYEKPEAIRNRLLMCIPQSKIQSEELKALAHKLTDEKQAHENKPFHQISTFTKQFSTDDWMHEQGVDISNPENARVLEAIKPLEEFERRYLNEVPSPEECARIEPCIRLANDLLSTLTPHDALGEQARGTLHAAAKTILKTSTLSRSQSVVQLSRDAVLRGARDPSPEFNAEHHDSFDMPSWGSPIPRIESAQGLCHFLWNWGLDSEVVAALEVLSRDKVPAVRFQVANGLLGFHKHGATETFWTLIDEMLSNEGTAGVMLALVDTLGKVAGSDPRRVVDLLSSASKRGLPSTERRELLGHLVGIFAGLYVTRNDTTANEQLRKFEGDPIKYHAELGTEIFALSHYLSDEHGTRSRAQGLLRRIITAVYKAMKELADSPGPEDKGASFTELLRLLDEVAFRVFVALDVNPQLRQGAPGLSDSSRREHYLEIKPIIELLTARLAIPGDHYLAPNSAHNLMQILNAVFAYDAKDVITYAAAVCRASARLNYQFDPSAIGEMVKLVEHLLADHKELLRDGTIADAVGDMLDIFVRAGWPQAVQLTFKLDQAIR